MDDVRGRAGRILVLGNSIESLLVSVLKHVGERVGIGCIYIYAVILCGILGDVPD